MHVSPATVIGCLSLESVGRKDRVRLSFVSEPSERNNEVAAMHIPHELQDEFPDEVTLITQLRKNNYLFMRLTRRYDEVNGQIYRIEFEEEPTTDGGSREAQERTSQAQGPNCPYAHKNRAPDVASRSSGGHTVIGKDWLRKALSQGGRGDQHPQ